jgi:tetratricopeptide (TPR) repeat protein
LVRRVFDMEDSQSRLHASLAAALPLLKDDDAEAGTHSGNLRGGKAWALPLAGAAAVATLALYGPWRGDGKQGDDRTQPALVATERAPGVTPARATSPVGRTPTVVASEAPVAAPAPTAAATGGVFPDPAADHVARPARTSSPGKVASASQEASARAFEVLASAEDRFQWGDLEGAETLARAAVRNLASSPRAFYLLGVVLLARGDANKAKDAFERTLALDPTYTDADAKLRLAAERAALSKQN